MLSNLLKSLKITTLLFLIINTVNFSNPSYKMTIENLQVEGLNKVSASIYIENLDEEFELTSYQCALGINQNIDLSSLSLTYIVGSSELVNEPDLHVGVDNIDGPTELTFVSFIGNDIISKKTLVGNFMLEGNLSVSSFNLLDIKWDFEGTICTIITGKDFDNITNPKSHISLFPNNQPTDEIEKINIVGVTASSTSDTNTTPEGVIDGKGFSDGDNLARWATQSFPASLIFDLGKNMEISKTRFSFFYFDHDRVYNYNVKVSSDKSNWTEVLSDVPSKEVEWSEEIFSPIVGRYVELEIISSINNPSQWANVWEAEIWGKAASDSVEIPTEITNLPISAVKANDGSTSAHKVIDGLCSCDGDETSLWSKEGMPASLIFDLNKDMVISKTRFSFFNFDKQRIYQYNVRISSDKVNWADVLIDVSSKEEEWSEESFTPIVGRYVELEFINSTNNPAQLATLWEAELWGNDTITSVEDDDEEEEVVEVLDKDIIPGEYGLSQNYPNPFNPTTNIEVRMKESGSARLDIYNLLGERVLDVLDQELTAGVHTISIDGSRLASGVYIYQLSVENKFSEIKKMNLLK